MDSQKNKGVADNEASHSQPQKDDQKGKGIADEETSHPLPQQDRNKGKGIADEETSHPLPQQDPQNPPEDFDWLLDYDIQDILREDIFDNRATFDLSNELHEMIVHNAPPTLNQDPNIITEDVFQDLDSFEELGSLDSGEGGDSLLASFRADPNLGGEVIGSSSAVTTSEGDHKVGRKRKPLELEEIKKYFGVPMVVAAKELGVGVTKLKKSCREFNITKWPHKKFRSLQTMIQNSEELGLKDVAETLAGHKRLLEESPNMELSERGKKFRQACFKAVYRKRGPKNQEEEPKDQEEEPKDQEEEPKDP